MYIFTQNKQKNILESINKGILYDNEGEKI